MGRCRKDDELLILALAQGLSHVDASRVTGVSERTIRRRLREPEFAERVTDARGDLTRGAAARLAGLYKKAIAALDQFLDDPDPAIQFRAVQIILKTGPEFRSHTVLEERLRALEDAGQPQP